MSVRHGRRPSGDSLGSTVTVDQFGLARAIGAQIAEALDPSRAPGRVRRFTPEEIAALNAQMKKGRP